MSFSAVVERWCRNEAAGVRFFFSMVAACASAFPLVEADGTSAIPNFCWPQRTTNTIARNDHSASDFYTAMPRR